MSWCLMEEIACYQSTNTEMMLTGILISPGLAVCCRRLWGVMSQLLVLTRHSHRLPIGDIHNYSEIFIVIVKFKPNSNMFKGMSRNTVSPESAYIFRQCD